MQNVQAIQYTPTGLFASKLADSGVAISGERNCPAYRAAERSGITVVAASWPAFIDAIVFK